MATDIAVVGMACRLPGNINSPDQLWKMILEKRDASGEIPEMRWEPYVKRDTRNAEVLQNLPKRGYFLEGLEDFDAAFFGISPKEAEQMDPQQRIVLEVVWEALERAGIPPQSLSASDTGVFMGVNSDDYSRLLLEDLPGVEPWMGIGTAYCGVPNRVSYQLNLLGPSLAVDAACASSLVAIHLGKQALIQGESKVVIVGGVNAMCSPGLTAVLDKAGATCKEGICQSFDDSAHGYGRGEGAGIVVLKRLDDAINKNDNILAVIRGSSVAQDGRTNGIMAPNASSQELVAMKALSTAGVSPDTVDYVEAHATSTSLGDGTEIKAISQIYGHGRKPGSPCYVGSAKPNVGHLEAGAGVVGFIKAVMGLREGILPPQANFMQPNSKVDWSSTGIKVVEDALEWPESDRPRRAAVCSYGYGGTVSHVVLEQYTPPSKLKPSPPNGSQVLLLSAPQEKRIKPHASSLSHWMDNLGKDYELSQIITTLSTRRHHHDYRAALVVDDRHDAIEKLNSLSKDVDTDWVTIDRVLKKNTRKEVTFLFSGHGAQWPDMAKGLLENHVFHDTVAFLDPIVQEEMGFSALQSFKCGDFGTTDQIQVLTYLIQMGIAAVLETKGIVPNAIIGHSVGEVAAAVSAGCLTSREGALIVTKRAKLYRSFMGPGAMAVAYKPFDEIRDELGLHSDIVAAINSSPSTCVLSGNRKSLETFCESLKSKGTRTLEVKTDIAFHHPDLATLVEPLRAALDGLLVPQSPKIKIYSTSLDDPRSLEPRGIDYWCKNMVHPVQLSSAVNAAAEDGLRLFLELSSHPIISHSVQETLMTAGIDDFGVYHTMRRGQPAEKSISYSLAQLHCRGHEIDWRKFTGKGWIPNMPVVDWKHQKIWKDIKTGSLGAEMTHKVDQHSFLGLHLAIPGEDVSTYVTTLNEESKPFPGDHPVHGSEIVPAAVLINTFLLGTGARQLTDFQLRVPIATNKPRDIQVVVKSNSAKICSRIVQSDREDHHDDRPWQTHTTGCWSSKKSDTSAMQYDVDIECRKKAIGTRLDNNFSIDYLSNVDVSSMGFPWSVLEHYGNQQEMVALVNVAPDINPGEPLPWDPHSWAPIVDAATSVGSTLFFSDPRLRMPSYVDKISILTEGNPPQVCYLYVEAVKDHSSAAHITICDQQGKALLAIESMQFSEIQGNLRANGGMESLVHQTAWPPAVYNEKQFPIEHLVLICDDESRACQYKESLSRPVKSFTILGCVDEFEDQVQSLQDSTAIIYLPTSGIPFPSMSATAHGYAMDVLEIVKQVSALRIRIKIFVLATGLFTGQSETLAHSPLIGLARIIASEQPEVWGSLIDLEEHRIPLEIMKYIQGDGVVRISDGVPRIARLRPLSPNQELPSSKIPHLFSPSGTYVITGGLGVLGLEIAEYLVDQGARRLILISRRALPHRKDWEVMISESDQVASTLERIQRLEAHGASVMAIPADMSSEATSKQLTMAIDAIEFPPVSGVFHAAGVLENELVLSTTAQGFSHVLSPKIAGAMILHELFPPKTLDFMVFFSSCGQLFGFPGQASYASANAFLDTLATHRRSLGDNTVSVQWTSWRGMGMSASTEFIDAELANKGITDVKRDEAFQALQYILKYDVSNAAVLRALPIENDEPLASSILADIVKRKAPSSLPPDNSSSANDDGKQLPSSTENRRSYLEGNIRETVSQILHMAGPEDVDPKAVMSDLGLDSVLAVRLRGMLQKSLKVNVPPTLTWTCPTVLDLVGWFESNL